MVDRYKIIYESSVEGLQNRINELSAEGYRALNVTHYPTVTHYGVIALLEYEGQKPR